MLKNFVWKANSIVCIYVNFTVTFIYVTFKTSAEFLRCFFPVSLILWIDIQYQTLLSISSHCKYNIWEYHHITYHKNISKTICPLFLKQEVHTRVKKEIYLQFKTECWTVCTFKMCSCFNWRIGTFIPK